MTLYERYHAVKEYWNEQNQKRQNKSRKPRYPDILPMVNGQCNCDGSGWFMLVYPTGQSVLTKCQCGSAGQSPQEIELSRELDVLANRTFDTFTIDRPYVEQPTMTIKLQQDMVRIAMHKAYTYAEKPHGWLYIHGKPGTGKSHLAAAIANHNRHRMKIIYRSMPAMLDLMRENSFNLETLSKQITSADLLILDDIGAEGKPSDWTQTRVFTIINGRVDKPTVFTSNYDVQELQYGSHIIDRLNNSRRCWINASSMRMEVL